MAKTKVSEWSSTAANNTDINSIDIAEGCAPSGINNAIREMMAQVKDMQAGTDNDNLTVGGNLSVTGTTTATGAITANGGVIGNVTGNLTGNVTGNVTGNADTATSATTATTATKATNISGGGAGQVPYNSGVDTTAFLAAGTTGQILQSNGTSAPAWATLNTLTSATAQASTSGTAIEFTSIPSWVKKITVMFSGVSTNGTAVVNVQLGDSGGYETTGYAGAVNLSNAGGAGVGQYTGFGFDLERSNQTATSIRYGILTLSLIDSATNSWVAISNLAYSNTTVAYFSAGGKSLSATLDRLRIIGSNTGSPVDTFDAGKINIMYE